MKGYVRKRGDTWSYCFEQGVIDGKRKRKEKSGFKTKKDAETALTNAMAEFNNTGRTFSTKDISVADYLDYWLTNAIEKNIDHGYTYNTYKDYEAKVRIHLKPAFGVYKLSSFQYASDKIQIFIDNLKVKGYSKNMVKNTLTVLQGAMNYAITPLQYIQNNPCLSVKVGKIPVDYDAKEHTEYVLTKDDFKAILDRFPIGSSFRGSLVVPYYIGTRIGETFGICEEDIDFEKNTIRIDKQMVKVQREWFYKPPKYDSRRTIKIGDTLVSELKAILHAKKVNAVKYGENYYKTYITSDRRIVQHIASEEVTLKEIHPISVKENGQLLTPESFKYCARVIHNELSNPLFHSHALRHTHGTILAEGGVNPKTVMERLGHKDITTTLGTYTFNTDVMQNAAVTIFEQAAK